MDYYYFRSLLFLFVFAALFGAGTLAPWITYRSFRYQPHYRMEQAYKTLLNVYSFGAIPLLVVMFAVWIFTVLSFGDVRTPEWMSTFGRGIIFAVFGGLLMGWHAWRQRMYILVNLYLALPIILMLLGFAGTIGFAVSL